MTGVEVAAVAVPVGTVIGWLAKHLQNGKGNAAQRELERERHEAVGKAMASQVDAVQEATKAMRLMTGELREVVSQLAAHREEARPAITAALETAKMVADLHSGAAPRRRKR